MHWFPKKPWKGTSYRCIRINERMDTIIEQAGKYCGFSPNFLHQTLPMLIMWIDPLQVSFKIGCSSSICILYQYKEGQLQPWRPLKNFSKKSRLPFINFLIHIINLSQVKVSEFQFAKFQDCLIKFFHQKYCKQYKSQLKPYKVLKNFDKSLKLPLINENSVTSCFKPKLDICNPNCKINNYIFDQQCFTIEQLATYVSNM